MTGLCGCSMKKEVILQQPQRKVLCRGDKGGFECAGEKENKKMEYKRSN